MDTDQKVLEHVSYPSHSKSSFKIVFCVFQLYVPCRHHPQLTNNNHSSKVILKPESVALATTVHKTEGLSYLKATLRKTLDLGLGV